MKRLVEAKAQEGKTDKETPEKKTGEKRTAHIPEKSRSVLDELRTGQGPFKIDDFEDKDLWSIYFNDKWKQNVVGRARLNVLVDPTHGANGTSSSMKIEYELLDKNSNISVFIGGSWTTRLPEVERDRSNTYDLSRFNKMVFYLKGLRSETFFSKPNNILVYIHCFGEDIKSRSGKVACYYNKTTIRPDKGWKRIEISLDDFAPTPGTKRNAINYPEKPDLHNVLNFGLTFSSFESEGGIPGSNTVWVDEITLE